MKGNRVTAPSDQKPMQGKMTVITGGAGVLGSALVRVLAQKGGRVAIIDSNEQACAELEESCSALPGVIKTYHASVLEKESLVRVAKDIRCHFGQVHALINAAGGNHPKATTGPVSFFDLPEEALRFVMDLNFLGTFFPCQVFGRYFAKDKSGIILNISSMNAMRPLTKIPAYSASKAAISNFTRWLAVHMAQDYAPEIRVNAIAPGFFLTEQNRYLLIDKASGQLTDRGQTILAHTPMARFGQPQDLGGAVEWLLSESAAFVTGVVIPIDGGFSAFSGI